MSNFSGKKSKSFGNLKVKSSNTKPINSQSKAEHKVGIDLEHEYWMTATCLQNLEDELESELLTLGAKQIKKKNRAVEFKGDKRLMYRSNLWLRTALRVLVPLSSFSIKNEDDLYQSALKIEWEKIVNQNITFTIDSSIYSPLIKNTQFATLRLKDAIVDRFKNAKLERPSVSRDQPDLRIHLHISNKVVVISLDSSGEPLFKRGYRERQHRAPINECLAAGMILKTGWKGDQAFLDPMCGSATIAIEACMIACNIPPNLRRMRFGFESWRNYSLEEFSEVLNQARDQYKPLQYPVYAFDINSNNIRIARTNINSAQLRKHIVLDQKDFFKLKMEESSGIMVMNPPYGERLELKEGDLSFYEKIGSTLKHQYHGWQAWIIASEMESFHKMGLKADKKIKLKNGRLDCEYRAYELFEGKREAQLN